MVVATATPGQGLSDRIGNLIPISLGLGTVLVVFAIAFLPSIQWVLGEWSSSSGVLSHGYLVAAMSAYLFIRAIPDVAAMPVQPIWWVLPISLAMSIVWLLGYAATVVAVQSIVLPAILLTTIAGAFGLRIAKRLAFPVLFLYFAVPALDHLQLVFQNITVAAVSILIRIADIPALVTGNLIHIPQGVFEIAGGCSGLSFIVAGLSLAAFYSYLNYTKFRYALGLTTLTLVVAMIGNWIRVFVVILAGYQTDMQSPLVRDHLTMGWIIFAVLMIPVYFVAIRWDDESIHRPRETEVRVLPGKRANWLAVGVASLAMVAGPIWANSISTSRINSEFLQISFPAGSKNWVGPEDSNWDWEPAFASPALESIVQYDDGNDVVLAYMNVYLSQEQGRELIFYSNDVAGGWRRSSLNEDVESVIGVDNKLRFKQLIASNYLGDWLIWYRYQNGTKFDVSESGAKFSQASETLLGRPEAGLIAFATPCRQQCDAAAQRLSEFVVEIGYMIHLANVRGQK